MTAETTVTMQADLRETSKNDPILLAAIHAVQNGDSRAFEQIMIATERRVALLCWRILGDADAVKDAMQEVFLRVFRHLRKFDERRDFMGWLFRITVNVCRDHSSRQKKRTQVFTDLEEAESIGRADDTDARIAAKEELALLERAIDTLPEKERLALILRDVEEIPTEEVAQILGSRPATVRVQISSARAKIRKLMERWR